MTPHVSRDVWSITPDVSRDVWSMTPDVSRDVCGFQSNYSDFGGVSKQTNYSLTAFVAITMAKSSRVTGVRTVRVTALAQSRVICQAGSSSSTEIPCNPSPPPLRWCLSSLLQNAERCRTEALEAAIFYLENSWMSLPEDKVDVFETCIATYALQLAGSQKATEAFYMMDALRRTGKQSAPVTSTSMSAIVWRSLICQLVII